MVERRPLLTALTHAVLILGVIQSLITFDGTLSSWWTRIAVGVLLCAFCLLQRLFERSSKSRLAHV